MAKYLVMFLILAQAVVLHHASDISPIHEKELTDDEAKMLALNRPECAEPSDYLLASQFSAASGNSPACLTPRRGSAIQGATASRHVA